MDRSQAEALVHRWTHEGVAKGKVEVFDELVSADAIDHSGSTDARGVEGFKVRTHGVHVSFTDIEVVVDDLLVEGDKMAWRWTLTGAHHGPFLGVSPTGKRVSITGMNIKRVANGMVVEHWSNADQLGLLRQVQAPSLLLRVVLGLVLVAA
jgi:predicted ester cyclase